MLNIVSRLLINLLPTGIVWRMFGDKLKVFDGIGTFFNRQKLFLQETIRESTPQNSIVEIQKWFEALSLPYNPSIPLQDNQRLASSIFTSIGGQSIDYLTRQIQIAFPEIGIVPYEIPYDSMAGRGMAGKMVATNYPNWVPLEDRDGSFPVFNFRVTGGVESPEQFVQLQDIVARIFPAHLHAFYQDIEFFPETMMAGFGRAGRGMAGRFPNQEPVNPILLNFNDDDGLLFTRRSARLDGLGLLDGRTLLNPQANLNVTTVKLGSGGTAPNISDTDLQTPIITRTAFIVNNPNGTRTYRIVIDKADIVGQTVREAGLFGSFGMVWRVVFDSFIKTNDDIVIFEFTEKPIA